ncbi:MAG TPA: TIGR03087 family PEP-CTERM/XrtA system glycosyltransferase [Alphaproteobacteria bacterium]|nr:TIGR03087 family PEP-CTERM/XrtA system glycosyltransferase [Alphaproteobacteria bacterium]
MEILFLAHRIPYPPNKGDKIRSWHMLEHLCRDHDVTLGCFVDDPDDWRHEPMLQQACREVRLEPLPRSAAQLRNLPALWTRQPLSVAHYRRESMRGWVNEVLGRRKIAATLAFSGAMAQYVMDDCARAGRLLVDFVDVDSDKWRQYAQGRRGPMRWLYAREGRTLAQYERRVALTADASLFVSEREVELFRSVAPEAADSTHALRNGVDAAFFAPDSGHASPFRPGELPLVFTGAMDYWANIDAATWFAREVLPQVAQRYPTACFWIVGSNPTEKVMRLRSDRVVVTGRVPDTRPYLAHAAVVVAPLRIARGVQNKVLEGMAMARPVVASGNAVQGIEMRSEDHALVAEDGATFAEAVVRLLDDPAFAEALGRRARDWILGEYQWARNLRLLDRLIEDGAPMLRRAAAHG